MKPSLIVHGGAWSIPDESVEACRSGIHRALEVGWKILSSGGPAIDAVERSIIALEDDLAFDAGIGSHLNRDGRVQLDAILMDGSTLKAGAVAAVERIRNPISLARCVLEKSQHMMLVGSGAEQFASENGVPLVDPAELITEGERSAWRRCLEDSHAAEHHLSHEHGTVGAVAVDSHGNLFAGTSTGGTCCKYPGRVGDSPLIGCGCYADTEWGGVSCTGHGEGIMKIVMAKMAVDLLAVPADDPYAIKPKPEGSQAERNHAQFVADACVRKLSHRTHTTGGLILLDREGNPAASFSTPRMAHGFVERDGSFRIAP
ncbi:MAG TPA: isoaspartyl peptidase/L-asparaginase [Candidatus Limnocylindrales bacterium]|nr:isoaspartyl peptidase/L-asparaginase [Candidatus Limnocylindrales bacterium]